MNENLNLVKILKNCPRGTKLYSTVYGEVEFLEVTDDFNFPINVRTKYGNIYSFTFLGSMFTLYEGECLLFPSKEQRDWSKFKVKEPKFDPKTLKPFDKVLVRDGLFQEWRCTFFSHICKGSVNYPYIATNTGYSFCIPYNDDTKHLVGTTKDAPEFYRY